MDGSTCEWTEESVVHAMMTRRPQNNTLLTHVGRHSLHFSPPNDVEWICYYLNAALLLDLLCKYRPLCKYHWYLESCQIAIPPKAGDLIIAFGWIQPSCSSDGRAAVGRGGTVCWTYSAETAPTVCLNWLTGCPHARVQDTPRVFNDTTSPAAVWWLRKYLNVLVNIPKKLISHLPISVGVSKAWCNIIQ